MKAKKIFCTTLASALAISTFAAAVYAEEQNKMTVTLRIEGISENLYYDTIDVPYIEENPTVQDAIVYADEQSDDITVTGADIGWITSVNNDAQGTFGGWDGWLYTVNGVSPNDTIDTYTLSDGDSIVLYYGDPYGVGMQYPTADVSKISEGILTFTSEDTVYDADWNPSTVKNPVTDAKVTWSYNGDSVEYITDENGSVKIDSEYLTVGEHGVAIDKVSDDGLPLVLRLAPDYSVNVAEVKPSDDNTNDDESKPESSEVSNGAEESPKDSNPSSILESENPSSTISSTSSISNTVNEKDEKAPSTGDSTNIAVVSVVFASAVFASVFILGKRKNEE